jgi:drug/metabolite transporter (DMT)-like permease
MTDRARGILLVLTATLLWGAEPLWIRSTSASEWQILFWSGALMTLFMAIWMLREHGPGLLRAGTDTGRPGILAAVSLVFAYGGYILALGSTTVANAVMLLATAPLMSALLGRIFLGERLRRRTMLALGMAIAGVAVMVSDSLDSIRLTGDLIALGTGVAFAVNIIALRSAPVRDGRPVDMMPSNATAGILIAGIALFLDDPLAVANADIPYLLLIGLVAMGLGTWLFTRGVRHVQAAEAGLLCLGESVTGPILVWIFIGEIPETRALMGAAIILAALVYDTMPERRAAEAAN